MVGAVSHCEEGMRKSVVPMHGVCGGYTEYNYESFRRHALIAAMLFANTSHEHGHGTALLHC